VKGEDVGKREGNRGRVEKGKKEKEKERGGYCFVI